MIWYGRIRIRERERAMKKNNKKEQQKRRGRVQVNFNTGQRVHKSKKDYKRKNKVDIPNNKEE